MSDIPTVPEAQLQAEFRYYQAHQMLALERVYDALLLIIDKLYDDDGVTAQRLIAKHRDHDYHWPDMHGGDE